MLTNMVEVELGKSRELLEIAGSHHPRRTEKDLASFLSVSERRAGLSRRERLRIVEQARVLMEMNYVHLPMKRAIHAIDPIQHLKLLKLQLAEWNVALESTLAFHRRMLSIFGSTRDLHTLYLLPEPFTELHRVSAVSHRTVFRRWHRTIHRDADRTQCGRRRQFQTTAARPHSSVESRCWRGTVSRS